MVPAMVRRPPAAILMLCGVAESHGVDRRVVLRGTGLSAESLLDPDLVVEGTQELAVLRNLVESVGYDGGLGVELGSMFRLSSFGTLGLGLLSSPDVRSAIEVGLRYHQLFYSFCDVEVRTVGDEARLFINANDVPSDLRRVMIESDMAATQTIQRDIFGGALPLRRVSFAFPPPNSGRVGIYEDVFGLRPDFDADDNVYAFDAAFMDLALPQSNALTVMMAIEECRKLVEMRQAASGWAGKVRELLLANLSCPLDAVQVSARLHMSERAMRGRLAAEGTSFRALLQEVRQDLAHELLTKHSVSVAEVARQLGYSELSSFSQAFNSWKGMSPAAYRASTR